jgi:phosphoglycerate dehydrogenase-like enzyme
MLIRRDRPQVSTANDHQDPNEHPALCADITVFTQPWRDEGQIARTLAPFQIVVRLRERTAFPARLIERLPNLGMVAMTGRRTSTLDIACCKARGILMSYTDSNAPVAPAERAFTLILACASALPMAHANAVAGRWQQGIPMGIQLGGKRLGIVGLGRLGVPLPGIRVVLN